MAVCESIASPTYLSHTNPRYLFHTRITSTDSMASMAQFFIPNKQVGDKLNSEDFRIRGYSKNQPSGRIRIVINHS